MVCLQWALCRTVLESSACQSWPRHHEPFPQTKDFCLTLDRELPSSCHYDSTIRTSQSPQQLQDKIRCGKIWEASDTFPTWLATSNCVFCEISTRSRQNQCTSHDGIIHRWWPRLSTAHSILNLHAGPQIWTSEEVLEDHANTALAPCCGHSLPLLHQPPLAGGNLYCDVYKVQGLTWLIEA